MTKPKKKEILAALEDLLRNTGDNKCDKYRECFSSNGWGWLAYDDPLSNAAGGKPWAECYCADDAQRKAAKLLNDMNR